MKKSHTLGLLLGATMALNSGMDTSYGGRESRIPSRTQAEAKAYRKNVKKRKAQKSARKKNRK